MSVLDMTEKEFKAQLDARTTPEAVFENARYIYEFLSNLFHEEFVDSLIREWAFQWYASETGESYEKIYQKWLSDDPSKEFVLNFARTLESKGGDTFFTTGRFETDEKMIKSTIDGQGYWAGNKYRYFFDKEYNFVKLEERRFGNEVS